MQHDHSHQSGMEVASRPPERLFMYYLAEVCDATVFQTYARDQ